MTEKEKEELLKKLLKNLLEERLSRLEKRNLEQMKDIKFEKDSYKKQELLVNKFSTIKIEPKKLNQSKNNRERGNRTRDRSRDTTPNNLRAFHKRNNSIKKQIRTRRNMTPDVKIRKRGVEKKDNAKTEIKVIKKPVKKNNNNIPSYMMGTSSNANKSRRSNNNERNINDRARTVKRAKTADIKKKGKTTIKKTNKVNNNIENNLKLIDLKIEDMKEHVPIQEIKVEEKEKDNTQLIEKGKNVLIKVLQQFFEKKGPINKIYTLSNSTEPERVNIIKLAEKYNFPLNSEIKEEDEIPGPEKEEEDDDEKDEKIKSKEENIDTDTLKEKEENIEDNNTNNIDKDIKKEEQDESKEKNIFDQKITKWEYVSTEKPDKIDKKLELYLKYFYSKRTFPVVIFKKTSTNNYEYGKQKVMIKIEGDTIRVRHLGSYLILDKFIELNAATEEKKLKKNNEKNTNADSKTNKKKEIIQKKKK